MGVELTSQLQNLSVLIDIGKECVCNDDTVIRVSPLMHEGEVGGGEKSPFGRATTSLLT
jgi:hypothetical protein